MIRKRCSETAVRPQNSGFPPCVAKDYAAAIVTVVTMVVIAGRGDQGDGVIVAVVDVLRCRRLVVVMVLVSDAHKAVGFCHIAGPAVEWQCRILGVNTGSDQSSPPCTLSSDSVGAALLSKCELVHTPRPIRKRFCRE